MNKQKFRNFIDEFHKLQDKFGIYVSSGYEEEIDYNWDEEPYTSGISSYLIYTDSEGNEFNENDY